MPLKITFLITVDISEPPADGISLKEKKWHNLRQRKHYRRDYKTVHKLLMIEALTSHCHSAQCCLNTSYALMNFISYKVSELAKQQYLWFTERAQEQFLALQLCSAIELLSYSTNYVPNCCPFVAPPVSGMHSSVLNIKGSYSTLLPYWSSNCRENAGDVEEWESRAYQSSLKFSHLKVRGLKVSCCSWSTGYCKDSQVRYYATLKKKEGPLSITFSCPCF